MVDGLRAMLNAKEGGFCLPRDIPQTPRIRSKVVIPRVRTAAGGQHFGSFRRLVYPLFSPTVAPEHFHHFADAFLDEVNHSAAAPPITYGLFTLGILQPDEFHQCLWRVGRFTAASRLFRTSILRLELRLYCAEDSRLIDCSFPNAKSGQPFPR
jgi:hypothetical protein